jgi:hypothetical protein
MRTGLKNAQLVKDSVQAILADPHTSGNLSGYVGPNNPNLTIRSGDLSQQDTVTKNPDGSVTKTTVQAKQYQRSRRPHLHPLTLMASPPLAHRRRRSPTQL